MNPSRLWRAFNDAIMPLHCAFCGSRSIAGERFICAGCLEDLPRTQSPPPAASSPLTAEIAPCAYAFPVDAAIKALKFRRRLQYGPALAQLLCDASDELPQPVDAILPVPLHRWRHWYRGFNQALEIATPLARHLEVPLVRNVVRRRATPPQSGLSARRRAANLRGAFAVRGEINYRYVLIVDDVITTGATVRQLAGTVLAAGATGISALAVARA